MSNTAIIEHQTAYIVTKLVSFVEEDTCQTLHGHELAQEIREMVKASPILVSHILLTTMTTYADKIDQICKQYDGGLH